MNALDCVRNAVFTELIEATRAPTDADTFAIAVSPAWATTGAFLLNPSNPAAAHCSLGKRARNQYKSNCAGPRIAFFSFTLRANFGPMPVTQFACSPTNIAHPQVQVQLLSRLNRVFDASAPTNT
jgi:hypothetical protein